VAVARGRDTGASTHGCDDNTTGGVSMPTDSLRPALRWGDTALQARAAGEARLQSLLGAMASTHSEAEWSCVWEMWELWVLWEVGVGAVGAVGAVGGVARGVPVRRAGADHVTWPPSETREEQSGGGHEE